MSLILLDNIVENLLKDKAIESARSNLVFEKISKDKFNKIVESLRYFENITKHSKEFGLIHSKEKPLLEFCHTARNNTYHHLFEDERILDCCIYILFEFIKKNIQRLIDFGIYAIEHEERNRILKINKLNSFDNIFVLIKSFLDINKKPSEIFSEILIEYINGINEFFEYESSEDWNNFNSIIKKQFLQEKSNKDRIDLLRKPDIEKFGCFKDGWKDFENRNISNIVNQSYKLKNSTSVESFEKFVNINNRIYPYYLLMRFYSLEQENQAYLMED